MLFRARIENAFAIPKAGIGVMLTHVEGYPSVGMKVRLGSEICEILELGRNTTDGKAISSRDCLTGALCPPYGSVRLDWTGPTDGFQFDWLEEVRET